MLLNNTHTQNLMMAKHSVTMQEKQGCPNCGSLVWEQIRRTRLQKILKPSKGRCHCRSCQREFWKMLD